MILMSALNLSVNVLRPIYYLPRRSERGYSFSWNWPTFTHARTLYLPESDRFFRKKGWPWFLSIVIDMCPTAYSYSTSFHEIKLKFIKLLLPLTAHSQSSIWKCIRLAFFRGNGPFKESVISSRSFVLKYVDKRNRALSKHEITIFISSLWQCKYIGEIITGLEIEHTM